MRAGAGKRTSTASRTASTAKPVRKVKHSAIRKGEAYGPRDLAILGCDPSL